MTRMVNVLSDFRFAGLPVDSRVEDALALPAGEWAPATVPGGVHESLLAAGRIPHPYANENESEVAWIEERDWWYRGRFAAPGQLDAGERLRLRFLGLDTVAEVWLNGELLGRHRNMFRPAEFDVTERVRTENELLIRFSPPLQGLVAPPASAEWARMSRLLPADADIVDRAAQRRKASFSWGWDFNPRLPAIGIWRPVELVREGKAVISAHHLRTERIDPDGTAHLSLSVEVDRLVDADDLTVTARLERAGGGTLETSIPVPAGVDRVTVETAVSVADAELWWTHDLGAPTLHALTLELRGGNAVLDEVQDRVGIRTISLDRSADPEGGRLFRFVLNGVPIFARGASWVPIDMMVGSVTRDQYRSLIGLAVDGGMNMLRVWGGGVYEHDAFYTECDERGMLVWHDFMFANAEYPSEQPEFMAEVEAEVTYQVRRLRNRPSLALWNASNEAVIFHAMGYHSVEPGNWGWEIYFRLLPAVVAREHAGIDYWPGSPWGEAPEEGYMAAGGMLDGDRHAWEVWHGLDMGAGGGSFFALDRSDYATVGESRHYRRYARDRGKFISEFGLHAAPELATLRRWVDEDKLSVHSPAFDARNKDRPKDKAESILEIVTGLPASLEEYVDFTMVSQAEGLKFGIEHYRSRQPHNSGTLIWQLNDSWPGISWSIVDYDGVPKAGFYFAKRAFQPVLASFRHQDGRLELWLSNSTATAQTLAAEVTLETFDGTVRSQAAVATEVPAGESVLAWSDAVDADPAIVAWVRSTEGAFPDNRLFFGEIQELPLATPELDVRVEARDEGAATVTITTDTLAYLVRIPHPAPGARLSDNYVDVAPGRPVRIEVSGLPTGYDVATLRAQSYIGA